MNFLRNRPLRVIALSLLGSLFLLFLLEFIVIRVKIEGLEEIEAKKDYARSIQLDGQQLAYIVQLHIGGNSATADIYSRVQEVDHKLNILGNGGRVNGTDSFIEPLSRLPSITFASLMKSWAAYKTSVLDKIDRPAAENAVPAVAADTTAVNNNSTLTDSTHINPVPAVASATLLPGQWLTMSKWFERLMTDLDEEVVKRKDSVESWFLFLAIVDLLLLCAFYYAFRRFVLKELVALKDNVASQRESTSFASNEIGDVAIEVNSIVEQLRDATEFVVAIGEGKQDYNYSAFDSKYSTRGNRLADSLLTMQAKLKNLNEEEQKRQWANEGLTRFVDILRSSNDNITTLGDKIISGLVKYTNANQGGLYILNDEDEHNRHLELISLFAFDNKKFDKQRLKPGEGILGQTFLEKETTLLNDIPDEYVRITSGLGGANPKSLLMVPLKVDKEVYGIVELASFKNFQPYEIAFVEKLAETIASTLASVKAAQKNRHLIEQFQQQTEEMRAQEEEMRQNMEELQATQEELSRKEQDYILRIRELEANLAQAITSDQHQKIKDDLGKQISDHQSKIRDLERRLSEKPLKEDDWELAAEVERELRVQLDAMRITNETLAGKSTK
jgi:putative methionine-R-sulfoxide reductase with GAF domain